MNGWARQSWLTRQYLINWTASNGSWLFYLLTMPGWLPRLFYACITPPSSLVKAAFLWESLIWARTRFSFKHQKVKSFTDVMLKFKATKCFHILDAWKQEYLYTSSTYLVFTKCSLNAASYFSRDENTKSATVFYHCPFGSFIFLWNQPKSINMTRAVNVSVRKRLAHLFCTFFLTISKRQPIFKDSCTWTLKNDPQQSCSS